MAFAAPVPSIAAPVITTASAATATITVIAASTAPARSTTTATATPAVSCFSDTQPAAGTFDAVAVFHCSFA